MASNKRMKLDQPGSGAPVMSAFAARKRLRSAHQPSDSEPAASTAEEPAPEKQTGKRKREPAIDEPASAHHLPAGPSAADAPDLALSPALPIESPAQPGSDATFISKPPVQYSTFVPKKSLNYKRKTTGEHLLWMMEGEQLVILGSYVFRVCKGTVTLFGASLSAAGRGYLVHAPYCHAFPMLQCVEDAHIELAPVKFSGLEGLGKLNPAFRKIWCEGREDGGQDSFQIIATSDDLPRKTSSPSLLASPAEWNRKSAELTAAWPAKKPAVVLVCGPKSAGKSTFGKMLANRLATDQGGSKKRSWSKVAVLDVDPGQPENAPPGIVSLSTLTEPNFSPSFCRSRLDAGYTLVRAHAIASVTPGTNPEHFLWCALDLFSCYQRLYRGQCPLIINTPGWVQGTGLAILVELIRQITPTEVIYMSQEGPEETIEALKSACQNIPLHELPSHKCEVTPRTPLQLREMMAMAYFHLDTNSSGRPVWDTRPLTEMHPWRVRYKGARRGFIGIMCYDYQPPLDLLADSINGTTLALVAVEHEKAFGELVPNDTAESESHGDEDAINSDEDEDPECRALSALGEALIARSPEDIPMIRNHPETALDPKYSRHVALVIVRGIDLRAGELQLLLPLQSEHSIGEVAGNRLVLISGKFDKPSWAYTEDIYRRWFNENDRHNLKESEKAGKSDQVHGITNQENSDGEHVWDAQDGSAHSEVPWLEMLHDNRGRSVGDRVWRPRRDLGRPRK